MHTSANMLKDSVFGIVPAPEFCDSDTLLASLYRVIGFKDVNEGDVIKNGKALFKKLEELANKREEQNNTIVKKPQIIQELLTKVLSCPKSASSLKKKHKTFINTPITPSIAIFSGTNNFGNRQPWISGNLLRRMVILGSKSIDEADILWHKFYSALKVTDEQDNIEKNYLDDVYAIFIETEIKNWLKIAGIEHKFEYIPITNNKAEISFKLTPEQYDSFSFPAKQFVSDLNNLIDLKSKLCRKAWICLIDSIIRLASVSHVLWLSNIHKYFHEKLHAALAQKDSPCTLDEIFARKFQYATSGEKVLPYVKELLGITTTLNEELNFFCEITGNRNISLKGLDDINGLIRNISSQSLSIQQHMNELDEGLAIKSKDIQCSSGSGSNKFEFVRYILGQRATSLDKHLQGYDQGFFLKKKGSAINSPFVFSIGDTALLAICHCALSANGNLSSKSITALQDYMKKYGINISSDSIQNKELGQQLRLQGLLLDSPDAESSMQILPPFTNN